MSSPEAIPTLVDHRLLARRLALAPARDAGTGAGFLMARALDELEDRLLSVTRRFDRALVVGDATGRVAEALTRSGRVDRIETADPLGTERLPDPGAAPTLAVSLLALQWANDLPGLLVQIRRALAPDGLFLTALVGGDSLTELRQSLIAAEAELTGGATARVLPFIDVRTLGGLFQRAGFALPVLDSDRFTVRYDSLFGLVADLRAWGATNALVERGRPLTRAIVARAAAIYAERFADPDGRVRATFEIVSGSGWVPHESQQKPARPGSATVRLEDALGAIGAERTRRDRDGEDPEEDGGGNLSKS